MTKKTDDHHWVYPSRGEEIKLLGVCFACHQVANGLYRAQFRDPKALQNILKSMPKDQFAHLKKAIKMRGTV